MPESSPPTVARLNQAIAALLRRISDLDWTWSRELPLRMEAAGLVEAAAEVHTPAIRGGTPVAALQRMSFELMREPIIAAGLLGAEEVDAGLREYDNPAFVDYNPLFVVASGRRPLQPAAS